MKKLFKRMKANLSDNMKDETGALTVIEIVVLLMVIIGIIAVIALWLRGKVNSTLDKANEIDNI